MLSKQAEDLHTAAVCQEVGCGPCAVAKVPRVGVLGNGALQHSAKSSEPTS